MGNRYQGLSRLPAHRSVFKGRVAWAWYHICITLTNYKYSQGYGSPCLKAEGPCGSQAHPSSLSASASGSETARKGVSLLLRMKATWRAPVSELRLQLLPSDQLELSESLLARSVWDEGLILCRHIGLQSRGLSTVPEAT